MRKTAFARIAAGLLILPFLLSILSFAASNTIRFQGRLTDNAGNPMDGDSVLVQFSLHTADTGGTQVWSSDVTSVTTNEAGLFSTEVGPVTPMSLFSTNPQLYLQIHVSDGASFRELKPRQKLSTVPYAFDALQSSTALTALTVSDGAITSAKIQNGAVTAEKIAEEAVNSKGIADGSVAEVDLATGSVSSEKLQPASVTRDHVDTASFETPGYGLVPRGAIFMVLTQCPAGYSEVPSLRNRFPIGADTLAADTDIPNSPGQELGAKNHGHPHSHTISTPNSYSGEQRIATGNPWVEFSNPKLVLGFDAGGSGDHISMQAYDHKHTIDSNNTPVTALPPAVTVVFCQKD